MVDSGCDDALDRHGDSEVGDGLVDFAVNVRVAQPPEWLTTTLQSRLNDLSSYPRSDDVERAAEAVARRHGRRRDNVLLLAGAAEGFALLPNLAPRLATLIAPTFNEPERVLRRAGVPLHHVVLDDPWIMDADSVAAIPDDSDLVVLGNPTNPTSVLHDRGVIESMCRPGRIVLVDEAFADTAVGEPHSLASFARPDMLVLRSLTKSFGLAGLRAGYLLGDPDVLERLASSRAHWPLGTLQLAAIERCMAEDAASFVTRHAREIAQERAMMVEALAAAGVQVCGSPSSSFVMIRVPGGARVKKRLRDRGFAIRSCANFAGLGPDYLRLAVRPWDQVLPLAQAIKEVCDDIGTGH